MYGKTSANICLAELNNERGEKPCLGVLNRRREALTVNNINIISN
jgi:hypothetical protein